MFGSRLVKSRDEPFTRYGLLAEDIAVAEDGLSVTFLLDRDARFSYRDPVLAQDVKASFELLTGSKAHPRYRMYWRGIERAVVLDRRTVRFEFKRSNPELHLIAAEMPVFSREWIGDCDFDGLVRERPIASGPCTIERYQPGKSITYRRDED